MQPYADFTWPLLDGETRPPAPPQVLKANPQRKPPTWARDITLWGVYKREISRGSTLDEAAAAANLNSFEAAERLQQEAPKLYRKAVTRSRARSRH